MADVLAGRRVVLVHDWLTGMRGGEKVLESVCRLVPNADLVTLLHVPGAVSPVISQRRIRASWIGRLPDAARRYRHYLPLFPAAIEHFDLDDADLIISTSHCAAKAVVPTGRAVHLCYSHSPMRYAWDQFEAYFGADRLGTLGAGAARRVLAALARWDRATAPRVHRFLANSAHVAGRIARYYNRRATILHPPVDTGFFTPGGDRPGDRFLVVSALVPYKRIDTAIRAAAHLGVPLTIIGTGPDEARLRAMAGTGVTFLGQVDDQQLRDAYRHARALVLPGEEDFGIAPVEAMACGCPVIALGRGGVVETVDHDRTGLLVDQDTPEAFSQAMRAIDALPVSRADLHVHATQFSVPQFEAAFARHVAETLEAPTTW